MEEVTLEFVNTSDGAQHRPKTIRVGTYAIRVCDGYEPYSIAIVPEEWPELRETIDKCIAQVAKEMPGTDIGLLKHDMPVRGL